MEPKFQEIIRELNARLQNLNREIQKSMRILILDDEEMVQSVLRDLLEAEGYQVFSAATGEEGWRVLQTIPINLIILDKNLPGMSGIEFLQWVKRGSRETDVVIITGYASLESVLQALDLGAFDYLTKPFDLTDLSFKVRNVLKHQIRRQISQKVVEELKRVFEEFIKKGEISDPEAQTLIGEFTDRLNEFGSRIQNQILFSAFGPNPGLGTDRLLEKSGFQVTVMESPFWISSILKKEEYNVVILEGDDSRFSLGDLIREIKTVQPTIEVLISSTAANLDSVLQVLRRGVSDYMQRSKDNYELLERKTRNMLQQQNEKLRYHHLIQELNNLLKGVIESVQEPAGPGPVFAEIAHTEAGFPEMMELGNPGRPKEDQKETTGAEKEPSTKEKEEAFPCARVGTDMSQALAAKSAEPGCRKILVVDDEEIILEVMQELLEPLGFSITRAYSGEEALPILKRDKFCLLITDKNLPGISGLDLIMKSRDLDEDLEFMMMTGYASMDSAITAMDLGVCSYLVKPFSDLQEVRNQVRRALSRYEERVSYKQKLVELIAVHNQLEKQVTKIAGS